MYFSAHSRVSSGCIRIGISEVEEEDVSTYISNAGGLRMRRRCMHL